MFEEFKKFALRGNVVDLAVAVIIGVAFGAIVTSLVNDIIMPLIGAITGGLDSRTITRHCRQRYSRASPMQTRKSKVPCSAGASF